MQNSRVQKMVSVAMLAAIGVVLQFISIPILPTFSFLKVDFSDIPVLVSMFLFGPLAGVVAAFIRSTLHFFLTGASLMNLIGDSASFLATTLFTLPIFFFFNRGSQQTKNKISGIVTGIIAMTVFMSVANYFVITPLYLKVLGLTMDTFLGMPMANYILFGIIPFNLIKGGIVSAVFLVFHAKLLPWLSKKQGTIAYQGKNSESKIS